MSQSYGTECELQKYMDECLKKGSSAMGFLFKKVDRAVLEPVGKFPCFLIDCCLHCCLNESEKNSTISEDVILRSAVVKRILTIIQDFSHPLMAASQLGVISYILRSWNSSIEVVCYEAVDIFSMLLCNHCLVCSKCKVRSGCEWSDHLAKLLFENESSCRSRYKCILILLQAYTTYVEFIDEKLLEELYSFISDPGLSVVISEILSQDMVEFRGRWNFHNRHILSCLSSESMSVRIAIKDRLLPKLAKSKFLKDEFLPQALGYINENFAKGDCIESLLSISRFLVLYNKKCDYYKFWSDYVPLRTMVYAVLHLNVQVRLSAWILLSEHPQRTSGFSLNDLSLLRAFLITNMTEQSPAIRQKIIAGLRKILSRIAESSEQIIKEQGDAVKQIAIYNDFIRFMVSLAFDSISSGANFSRRMMALSVIQCLFVDDWLSPQRKTLFFDQLNLSTMLTTERFKAVLACIEDPFELCQITALDILKVLPVDENFDLSVYKDETIKMMKSIRSHNTLASGYRMQFYTFCHPESLRKLLVDFVSICEENANEIRNNLVDITKNAVHPWMNAILRILEKVDFVNMSSKDLQWWAFFVQGRLIPLCFDVAELVSPAVQSMSPEGYIPEETLREIANSSMNSSHMVAEVSQLLLACCWRAHKYVSATLGWVVAKLCPLGTLTSEDVSRIGAYYWLQLTECKHFGAFETAVEGFSSLCVYLWRNDDLSLPRPVQWLHQILDALEGNRDLEHLCSTRRSAGVPHLVATILATEPLNHPSQSLRIAMTSLLEIGQRAVSCRIHTFNVLKALFSSAALGERITPALEWACRVAFNGCSASTWSERNAAAQLAATLRTRIFGVMHKSQRDLLVDPKNRKSSYEFFSKFPSLYGYLFDQLYACKDEFSVYPTLLFLIHLFPSHADLAILEDRNSKPVQNFPLAPFIPALLRVLLWCRAEMLRTLTAATVIAIARLKDISFVLDWISTKDLRNVRENHIHAVLLLISFILETNSCVEVKERVRKILINLNKHKLWLKWCDTNKSVFLFLCNTLCLDITTTIDIDKLVLAKRPFAKAILLRENLNDARLLSDLELRLQFYRHVQISGRSLKNFKFILDFLINDLDNCANERDASYILDVIYLNKDSLSATDQVRISKSISVRLERHWRMLSTISMGRRLLAFLSKEITASAEELKWMELSINAEDDMSKRIVLQVGAHRLKHGFDKHVIAHMVAFLQDDDISIREAASSILSPIVLESNISLNPAVCYRLITELMPSSGNGATEEREVHISTDDLYDVCSSNPYAESRYFGDITEVKRMVSEIL